MTQQQALLDECSYKNNSKMIISNFWNINKSEKIYYICNNKTLI
jgi:hypothetical protein